MSHVVVRGSPTASQLALDVLLDEVVAARGGTPGAGARARTSLPQLLFHCLKAHPEDLFMINADTDEKTTNHQLLSQAVSLARTFLARGVKGKVVVLLHDTHRTMIAVYLTVMFAGAVPYVMFNENTAMETASLLELLQPVVVTCDARHRHLVTSALDQLPGLQPQVLLQLEGAAEADVNSFQLPEVDPEDTAVMLGTSGTTGLPKSVELTHRGLIAAVPWPFGRPQSAEDAVDLMLVTFASDGIGFLRNLMVCIVRRMVLLLPQTVPSAQRLRDMLLKYRPSLLLLAPLAVSTLLPLITTDHFSSLRLLILAGSSTSEQLIADVKEKLPASALFYISYGSTEAHGGVAMGPAGEHLRFSNCIEYKVVDDSGDEVGNGENGELYIRGQTLLKGYYKIKQHESFEDGWLRMGDVFHKDGQGNLWYLERKGICFKFMGAHVSPAETEQVIESVEGVVCSFVTATERGSAAAVVAGSDVTREMVHEAVKASLSENKWLYGGVAFVPSLPKTGGAGKIHRRACKELLQQKFEAGECY